MAVPLGANNYSSLSFSSDYVPQVPTSSPLKKVPVNSPMRPAERLSARRKREGYESSLNPSRKNFSDFTTWLSGKNLTLDSRIQSSPFGNKSFSPEIFEALKARVEPFLNNFDLSQVYIKLLIEERESDGKIEPFLRFAVMTQASTEESNSLLIPMEFQTQRVTVEGYNGENEKKARIADEAIHSATPSPKPSVRKFQILVVEDGVIERKMLKVMLNSLFEPHSFEIQEATTGLKALNEALARYRLDQTFDLILLDTDLPPKASGEEGVEIKGPAAATVIRTFDAETPIISISSNKDEESINKCKEAGVDAFHHKPFNKAELLATIREFASEEELPSAIQRPSSAPNASKSN